MPREKMMVEFFDEDMKAIAMVCNYVDNKYDFDIDADELANAVARVTRFWNEMHWQKGVRK
jgi:hypothetical protein